MFFLNKHSVYKPILISCSLAIALVTTACNDTPEATDDAVNTSKTDAKVPNDTKSSAVANEEVFMMTSLGLESINNMIIDPFIASDEINEKQKSCLAARDKNLGQSELQDFYNEKFTEAELKALNNFYNSAVGQKILQYGKEEMILMNGGEVATPMADPTEEEVAEIQAFMQSPTGTKYARINNEVGEGSAIAAIEPPINAKLKSCNINYTLADLMQPPAPAPTAG